MADVPGPKRMAYYAELSQVGFEMAAPIGLGALVDYWVWDWHLFAIIGAVLGLVGGITHLVILGNRESQIIDEPDASNSGGSSEAKP